MHPCLTGGFKNKSTHPRPGQRKRTECPNKFFSRTDSCFTSTIEPLGRKNRKTKEPLQTIYLGMAAWIIARIGGWKGYASESKPGNRTMRTGLMQFENIIIGWTMAKNLCA